MKEGIGKRQGGDDARASPSVLPQILAAQLQLGVRRLVHAGTVGDEVDTPTATATKVASDGDSTVGTEVKAVRVVGGANVCPRLLGIAVRLRFRCRRRWWRRRGGSFGNLGLTGHTRSE